MFFISLRCLLSDICLCSDVIEKVKTPSGKPFRPDLPKLIDNDANPVILELTEQCWAEDPHDRPDISAVLKKLKQINKGR